MGEASKINFNKKQKHCGGITVSEAMDLSSKYNQALESISYYKHEAKNRVNCGSMFFA